MPKGKVEEASNMDKFQHDVRHPAKDVHIMPGIERDSLLSIPKFADANYAAIFDKDEVNIYDTNKTTIIISRGAILQGWRCKQTNLWQVPLIKNVQNNNTDTVLCMVTKHMPIEGFFGFKPDIRHLKPFGLQVCLKGLGARPAKLDRNNFMGIFLGYMTTNNNILYLDLSSGLVKQRHLAQFN